MFYDVLWCSVMFYDVLWCSVVFYDVLWCSLMLYDVLRCSIMSYDVLWCSMIFYDVPWCSTMFHDVPLCSIVFHDVPWCFMMFLLFLLFLLFLFRSLSGHFYCEQIQAGSNMLLQKCYSEQTPQFIFFRAQTQTTTTGWSCLNLFSDCEHLSTKKNNGETPEVTLRQKEKK